MMIVGCHTKVVTLGRPRKSLLHWLNYAIYQEITTV